MFYRLIAYIFSLPNYVRYVMYKNPFKYLANCSLDLTGAMLQTGVEILVKLHLESKPRQKTFQGFSDFMAKSKNRNVRLLAEITFDHILSYFVLKAGIRQCNCKYFRQENSQSRVCFLPKPIHCTENCTCF